MRGKKIVFHSLFCGWQTDKLGISMGVEDEEEEEEEEEVWQK